MTPTWDDVLAWRMRRQFLDRPARLDHLDIVRRLCGVQAQVASAAEMAVCVRHAEPEMGRLAEALAAKQLVKTWAMRGALHVLPVREAAACLALLAATRSWEKPVWQRNFATIEQMDRLADAARTVLDGQVLTREELAAHLADAVADKAIAEHLHSGWGALLKPLAWQGIIVNGPSQGTRVTFTRPDTFLDDWPGSPDPLDAARTVIPAYLGAYGPASPSSFDMWLTRGVHKKSTLKTWFAHVVEAGDIVEIDVDGQSLYARTEDADSVAGSAPLHEVRLLPAFDAFVLGPGTKDTRVVAAERRAKVSRAAGWISPVVVWRGRVAGTWQITDGLLEIVWFGEAGSAPRKQLDTESARIGSILGETLKVRVTRD